MKLWRLFKVWVAVLLARRLHRQGWRTREIAKKGHCRYCGRNLGARGARFCVKKRCLRARGFDVRKG